MPRYRQNKSILQKNLQTAQKPSSRLRLVIFVLIGIIILLVPVLLIKKSNEQPGPSSNSQTTEPTFDKSKFSLDDPTSPWVVVNKQRPLSPKTYAPNGLRAPNIQLKGGKTTEAMQLTAETSQAVEALATAAQAEGLKFVLVSGYRSYNSQKTIYDSEVKGFGQAVADQESARPGHSEHQTGWAADLGRTDGKCEIEACFADTAEGKWLATNAHKYGFIIRYAKDKTSVTGYIYEPWHLRYVGSDLAAEMHRTNTETLEEFFGLSSAPTY